MLAVVSPVFQRYETLLLFVLADKVVEVPAQKLRLPTAETLIGAAEVTHTCCALAEQPFASVMLRS
jgi:hypothetical protein